MTQILKEYLSFRKGQLDDALFCKKNNKALSKGGIRTSIERYNKARGVNKTSIHLLRHNFATNYLYNGGTLEKLPELLTHANAQMSLKYAKTYCRDLKNKIQDTNPLECYIDKNK